MTPTIDLLKQRVAAAVAQACDLVPADIDPMVRRVQDEKFGDYQSNCAMGLAKRLGATPREIAQRIVDQLNVEPICEAPEIAVVERIFVAANPSSALVLGQARGALLASLGAAGIRVAEISARGVKKAVTGSGAADKAQMRTMVARLLSLDPAPPSDAADALALAFTYAGAGPMAELPIRSRRRNTRRATTQFVLGRIR